VSNDVTLTTRFVREPIEARERVQVSVSASDLHEVVINADQRWCHVATVVWHFGSRPRKKQRVRPRKPQGFVGVLP